MELTAAFDTVRGVMERLGADYAFIGALAAVAWGRPRATTDVDLVLLADAQQFGRFDAALLQATFRRGADIGAATTADGLPDIATYWFGADPAVRVDVFVAKTEFEREVVRTARKTPILDRPAQVASAEACIIYKLLASRHKDLADIEGILAVQRQLDWPWLERWADAWEIRPELEKLRG